jgi:hypothetical protein
MSRRSDAPGGPAATPAAPDPHLPTGERHDRHAALALLPPGDRPPLRLRRAAPGPTGPAGGLPGLRGHQHRPAHRHLRAGPGSVAVHHRAAPTGRGVLAWAADDWNFMATAEILLNFRLREKMLPAYLTWSPYTLSARHGWAARSDLPHPPAGSQTDGGQMTEGRCVQELRQRIEPLPGLGPMVGQQELPSSVIGRSCPGGRLGGAADRARPSAVQQLRAEPARARDLWGGGRGRPVPPATKGPFQPGRALGGGRPVAVACISERRGTSSSRGPVGTSRPPGAV